MKVVRGAHGEVGIEFNVADIVGPKLKIAGRDAVLGATT